MPPRNDMPIKPTVIVRKKKPVNAPIAVSSSMPPKPLVTKSITPSTAPSPVSKNPVISQPIPSQKEPVKPPPQPTAPHPVRPTPEPPPAPSVPDAPSPSDQPNKRQRLHQERLAILAVLRERWPQTFPLDFRQVRPFAVGLHLDIQQALPDVKPNVLRNAIHYYQRGGKGAYWRALLKGGSRYNLDGTPNGEVTEQDKAFAKQELAKAKEWWQAKRAG